MLMVPSNGATTVRATPENVRTLMACDDVTTFSESGWFCAVGWRESRSGVGRDRVIALHFNSQDEYLSATGQAPELTYGGYGQYGR